MRIQKVVFIVLFLSSTSLVALYARFSQNQKDLLSPIPDKTATNVLGMIATAVSTPTPTFAPTPTSTPTPKPKPTATSTPTPVIIAPQNLDDLFTKYAQAYSIDKEFLKRVAYCESRFNPKAGNEKYAGLFQFSETLWTSTRDLMGENSDLNLRFDPGEAVKTAAFMISQNHLGIWPNCN